MKTSQGAHRSVATPENRLKLVAIFATTFTLLWGTLVGFTLDMRGGVDGLTTLAGTVTSGFAVEFIRRRRSYRAVGFVSLAAISWFLLNIGLGVVSARTIVSGCIGGFILSLLPEALGMMALGTLMLAGLVGGMPTEMIPLVISEHLTGYVQAALIFSFGPMYGIALLRAFGINRGTP